MTDKKITVIGPHQITGQPIKYVVPAPRPGYHYIQHAHTGQPVLARKSG